MPFEFTRPWILAAVAVVLPWLVLFFVRSLSDFPRRQRIVSVVTRSLIALLILLSLGGLTWLHETDEQFVIVAIDDSLSVGAEGRAKVTETLEAISAGHGAHRVAYLPFAREPGLIQESPPVRTESPSA